jgi:hypothetical protein
VDTSLAKLWLALLIKPFETMRAVKRERAKLRYGLVSLLVHSAVAGSKMLYLHVHQVPPVPGPFLRIPTNQTWLYSLVFQVPVDLLQSILFAGVVTLIARLFRGRGSFEGQFALYGFAFPPVNVLLIVGTWVLSLLDLFGTPVWIGYFIVVLLWDLVLIALSVSAEQEIGPIQTLVCFLAGVVPAILFSLTYIR